MCSGNGETAPEEERPTAEDQPQHAHGEGAVDCIELAERLRRFHASSRPPAQRRFLQCRRLPPRGHVLRGLAKHGRVQRDRVQHDRVERGAVQQCRLRTGRGVHFEPICWDELLPVRVKRGELLPARVKRDQFRHFRTGFPPQFLARQEISPLA